MSAAICPECAGPLDRPYASWCYTSGCPGPLTPRGAQLVVAQRAQPPGEDEPLRAGGESAKGTGYCGAPCSGACSPPRLVVAP